LALRANGRYSFSAEYRITETGNRFAPFIEGVFEDGTYQSRANTITFSSTDGESLDVTGTLQGETLAVGVTDPIFEERETYTFSR
jgi:hypothetical protein